MFNILIVFVIGLLAYWPVFTFNFFWEDPFDIGQVEGYSFLQLLLLPNSNSYYRPLTLVLMKLLKLSASAYAPLPYHVFNVGSHLVAAGVLYGSAHHLFRNRLSALGASLLFLLYPPAFEATARASSTHSIFVILSLIALWLYAIGREQDRRAPVLIALALGSLAVLVHENGVLLPPMIAALEIFLRWQNRVRRFSFAALLFFIPALLFAALWFNIPKSGEPPQFGVHPFEALYLSQGLSFPFARLIAQTGGWGLENGIQSGAAILLSIVLLIALYGKRGRPPLMLAVFWWGAATSLAWLARPIEYLQVSPRVMYFPSFAAALAWAGIISDRGAARRMLGGALVFLIALQSWLTLSREVALYRAGSHLMDQIIAVGQRGGKQLFISAPDRFEYREPLYPLGYWGMLLAPVSQDLSSFVRFSTGVQMETKSLSDFPLLAGMIDSSPYRVNTRGVDAHASDLLYDTILWADETYWTQYEPDGALALKPVGDVRESIATVGKVGRFGDTAELLSADAEWDGGAIQLTLYWVALKSARPTDTVFVHLYNADGELVGQGDGDSLNGLLPPSAWRVGNEIEDRRTILTEAPLPAGEYRIAVGLYNRADGVRYPAFDSGGAETPDGELEAGRIAIP